MPGIREVSQALFGSSHRLEVAVAIARQDPGVFYARQIAVALALPDNVVGNEIRHLEKAGLLDRLPRVRGQNAHYLQRVESPVWNLMEELLQQHQGNGASVS